MATIQEQIEKGQDRWSEGIDAQSDNIDKKEIKEFIDFKLLEYETYKLKDDDLWETYREDFNTFTTQTFRDCNQITVRNLRQFLCVYSV